MVLSRHSSDSSSDSSSSSSLNVGEYLRVEKKEMRLSTCHCICCYPFVSVGFVG